MFRANSVLAVMLLLKCGAILVPSAEATPLQDGVLRIDYSTDDITGASTFSSAEVAVTWRVPLNQRAVEVNRPDIPEVEINRFLADFSVDIQFSGSSELIEMGPFQTDVVVWREPITGSEPYTMTFSLGVSTQFLTASSRSQTNRRRRPLRISAFLRCRSIWNSIASSLVEAHRATYRSGRCRRFRATCKQS